MPINRSPALRQRLEAALSALWQTPRPTLVARLLQPLSWLYGAIAKQDAARQLRRQQRAPVPLIVVGNLVAGGAGKTPTVIALVALLRRLGHKPGVISRGHGRQGQGVTEVQRDSDATAVGDEPLLIHRRSGAPVAVGADRLAAARALCAAHPDITVLVSDDGLQHRRLARDVQVLVFDDRGAGNGLLLPAGPLREPLPARVPAASVVLYTGGRASTALPGHLGQRRLAGAQPLADWWAGQPMREYGFAALRGRPLLAAAALARPEPFFAMLEAQGLQIERLPLPDHAALSPPPWPAGTKEVVVTEKDAVKLRPGRTGGAQVWVAALDFRPDAGFDAAVTSLCASWPTSPNDTQPAPATDRTPPP